MSKTPKIVDWKGPEGWRGEAIRDYRRFPFAGLPWSWIRHEEQSALGAVCVKSSSSRCVYRVDLEEFSGGTWKGTAYAKRYLANSWRRKLGVRLTGTKASHEFRLGIELVGRGISTPKPLAWAVHFGRYATCFNDRPIRLPPANYLLTLEWPNGGSVRDWMKRHPGSQAGILAELAGFLAEAHRLGFYHDDCSAEHLLIRQADPALPGRGGFEFCFIDVDNGSLAPGPIAERQRNSNLFQILRSIPIKLVPPRQRLGFLEAYLDAAGEVSDFRMEGMIAGIEKLAMRKVGRKVVRP